MRMNLAQRAMILLLAALLAALGAFLFLAAQRSIPVATPPLARIPTAPTTARTAPPWLLQLPTTLPADLRTRLTQTGLVTRPVRVYCESNPTPINQPNPEWTNDGRNTDPDHNRQPRFVRNLRTHQYMLDKGFKPVFVVYNGTLNRALTWADAPPQANLSRVQIDWKKEGAHSNPPTEPTVKAVATLAFDPSRFGDTLGRHRPIMFDIEAASEVNVDPGAPLEQRRAAVQHMIDTVRWARQASHERCDIWFYQYPHLVPFRDDLKVLDLNREFARQLNTLCYCFYNWDASAATRGDYWFTEITLGDLEIARLYPEFTANKIAVLIPVWQIYWPDPKTPEITALDGKPIPLDLWKRQVDFAIARGWDIFIWTGLLSLDPIREHLDYVAKWAQKGNQ
jgi:hypothetical protein